LQFFPQRPPSLILVAAGDRIGKERERHRAEAWETRQRLPFLRCGRTLLLFNTPQCADSREHLAGLGFFTARTRRGMPVGVDWGKGRGCRRNGCHGNLLCLWFLVSRRTRMVLASTKGGIVIRYPAGFAGGCGQRIDNAPSAGRIASVCGDGEREERFLDGRGWRCARARR
jgi:hypothetical protein